MPFATAKGMHEFVQHFCKNADGSWTCTSPATLQTPAGRIQVTEGSRFYPGTVFMEFDVAGWLEEHLDNRAERCE